MENTIVSISTSLGGAIAIVRVSGKNSINIVNKIFSKDLTEISSHSINYGFIINDSEKIDEVLLMLMKGPKTYTCEDLIEINCHGGIKTTNKILELLLDSGCELAEPGEFTKRAYLNGRIDLTKAEAVNDLINATSENARKMAMNAVGGKLYNKINELREKIVKILSNLEVNIDYPEYTDEIMVTEEMMTRYLNDIKSELKIIIRDSENARFIKNGINIAIVGKPNVGKSSLLNTFLDEEKAIVTNIPGTTRDIVEGTVNLEGIILNFIDTAGIRDTTDVVEKIGVEKSKEAINKVDLVILVLNNNENLSEEDRLLIESMDEKKTIIFVNKSDLDQKLKLENKYIKGNTLTLEGIDGLKKEIINKVNIKEILNKDMTYLGNNRQIDLIKKACSAVENAIYSQENGIPLDIIEIDLRNAWEYLGLITGEYYENELVDNIFSNFCLGK